MASVLLLAACVLLPLTGATIVRRHVNATYSYESPYLHCQEVSVNMSVPAAVKWWGNSSTSYPQSNYPDEGLCSSLYDSLDMQENYTTGVTIRFLSRSHPLSLSRALGHAPSTLHSPLPISILRTQRWHTNLGCWRGLGNVAVHGVGVPIGLMV